MNALEIRNRTQLNDIVNFQMVNAVSNVYTLDLSKGKNFTIATGDVVAKTVTFSSVPTSPNTILQVSVLLTYTNAAAITYPVSVVWKDGAIPVFTVGKKYMLLFTSYDNGTTWLGSYVGAW